MISHYYEPPHMTASGRNTAPCCGRPADEHRAWVNGSTVLIRMSRSVRGYPALVAGAEVEATRSSVTALRVITPSRWGTNVLGQFAELDRGTYEDVQLPGYSVRVREGWLVSVPVRWAKEIV